MLCIRKLMFAAGSLAAMVTLLAGCAQEPVAPLGDADAEPQAAHTQLDPEIEEALAALSPADREAALQQEICPVSGEPLGWMGTPPKINVQGREVFLCCERCGEALRENPDEYLARLTAE